MSNHPEKGKSAWRQLVNNFYNLITIGETKEEAIDHPSSFLFEKNQNGVNELEIKQMFLTPNRWSRPQTKLIGVRGIIIHWVANPNTSAIANRDYFESLKDGRGTFASAHYFVGQDGEIIQCLPNNEVGYHIGSRVYTKRALDELSSYPNNCTIGIECCHIDNTGKMKQTTYDNAIALAARLLKQYNLTEKNLWLHYETNGWKDCHRWFVNNPNEWKLFKQRVAEAIGGNPTNVTVERPRLEDVELVEADANGEFTVRNGDTLWGISQQLNISVDRLKELNPTVDPTLLKVGMKLRVIPMEKQTHTVESGETLWSIANKYNLSVEKLKVLNPNINERQLGIGQKLVISVETGMTDTPTPTPTPTPKMYPLPSGTLRRGSRGTPVTQLQEALNALNFRVGKVDGVYGAYTEGAIRRYQSMYAALTVDGVYGESTREQLKKDLQKIK